MKTLQTIQKTFRVSQILARGIWYRKSEKE